MAEQVTLRYQGEIPNVSWSDVSSIIPKLSSLDNKESYETQRIEYDPVADKLEVVCHVDTDTANKSSDMDELANRVSNHGQLVADKAEAKNDIEDDLFSRSRASVEGAVSGRGISATRSEIESVLSSIDQHQIKLDEKGKLTYERWDRQSPINSASASEIKARDNVPENAPIYLLKDADTGEIIYFQYTDPINGGYLDESNWESIAQQHIDMFAEQKANEKVVQRVINNL